MATYDFDRPTLPFFTDRVARIGADTPRRWGTMESTRALRHLIFTFEMSLGEHAIEDRTLPFARDLVYLVFFRWFTNWPKGKIKGKDFLCPPPKGDFTSEQRDLLAVMARYVDALEREPQRRSVNPGLGTISLRKWSRVHGVHTDHHLRQFGV